MDHAFVRTKLQAVILRSMVRDGLVGVPLQIVEVHDEPSARADLTGQRQLFDGLDVRFDVLDRSRAGRVRMALRLAWRLLRARLGNSRLFVANLHWAALGIALKVVPGARVHSFDDGTANVQPRPGSFLDETPSRRSGIGGVLSRALFPRGVACFVRSRISRHATIYPGLINVVPPDRLDSVVIDWTALLRPQDTATLRPGARRILLGSVYAELNAGDRVRADPEVIAAAVAWSDLHVPHPRESTGGSRHPVLVHAPAEALVAWYAMSGPLAVAHFNSSVALSFRDDPRIRWIDLLDLSPGQIHQVLCI